MNCAVFWPQFFFYLTLFQCATFMGTPVCFHHSACPEKFIFRVLFMRHWGWRIDTHQCCSVIKGTSVVRTECTVFGVPMFCAIFGSNFFYLTICRCVGFMGTPVRFIYSTPCSICFRARFQKHRCGRDVRHWCCTGIWCTRRVCWESIVPGVPMFSAVFWL